MARLLFLVLILISLISYASHHEELTSEHEIEGGTSDKIVTKASTENSEDGATDFIQEPLETGGTGTSANFLYSDSNKVFTIPISYSPYENLTVSLAIPYVFKEMDGRFGTKDLSAKGLGDISAKAQYYYKYKFIGIDTAAMVKFPTGNMKEFEDQKERLPLGTGSYDYMLNLYLTFIEVPFEKFRFLTGFSYRKNGTGKYTEKATVNTFPGTFKFEYKNGDSLKVVLGSSYFGLMENLMPYVLVKYLKVEEGHEKIYDDPDKFVNIDRDRHDGLEIVDLKLGTKYKFKENSSYRLGISIPVMTKYDSSLTNTKGREVMFDLGVDYLF